MDKFLTSDLLIADLIQKNLSSIKSNSKFTSFKFHVEYELLLGDVLEKAWTYRRNYVHEDNKSFLNWIGFIARNAAIDICRKKKKYKAKEFDETYMKKVSNQNFENLDYLKHVNNFLLGRFGEVKHLIITMKAKGWKSEEIAEELGISNNTIRGIIFRIRKDLSQKHVKPKRIYNSKRIPANEKNEIYAFTKNQIST